MMVTIKKSSKGVDSYLGEIIIRQGENEISVEEFHKLVEIKGFQLRINTSDYFVNEKSVERKEVDLEKVDSDTKKSEKSVERKETDLEKVDSYTKKSKKKKDKSS